MENIGTLRTSVEQFNDAKCDILSLEEGEEYKHELQEKTLKVEADMLRYREKASKFYKKHCQP